jgi:hypothetical protein
MGVCWFQSDVWKPGDISHQGTSLISIDIWPIMTGMNTQCQGKGPITGNTELIADSLRCIVHIVGS